jgi:hypothetical protein
MMTYGWAILIIVIVAAVLYSFGIFSPSSSISATITGFSGLGSVQAECLGNTSFTVSIGDSTGYSINITKINLTSSSGSTTYNPNVLIQPNSVRIVTVPSSSLCTAGSRYSVSAIITYTELGQVFPGPYFSRGTASGTANSPPSSITSYEPLTVTDSQNQGTPSPFQQMVNVTSSDPGWTSISSSLFGQNVEFFSPTGQILDSWLENYTSTHAIWWVKLPTSIPPGSSQTIYMGFAPASTNLFNTVNIGEAPQIPCGSTPTSSCSNYAEYDDGAAVFPELYNNFAGTTLNGFSGGTYVIDNGITVEDDGDMTSIYQIPDSNTAVTIFGSFDSGGAVPTGDGYALGYDFSYGAGATGLMYNLNSNSNIVQCINYGANTTNGPSNVVINEIGYYSLYSIYKQDNLTTEFYFDNNFQCGGSWLNGNPYDNGFSPISSFQFYTQVTSNAYEYWQYIFARSLPPNTIMPSVSFGSVS